MITHAELVAALAKPDDEILRSLQKGDGDLIHVALGLGKESGEFTDAIARMIIYRKPLDHENCLEELGDLEFFMERARQVLGVTREQCIAHNIAKLQKRYPSGTYSNEQANARADKTPIDRWYCEYCNAEMTGDGYVHKDGYCYCSESCAEAKNANR